MGEFDYGTLFLVAVILLLPSAIILTIFTVIRIRRGKIRRRRSPFKQSKSSKPQKTPVAATKKKKS
jgi:hypothetical protein